MPKNPSSKTALKARIDKQLAQLAGLMSGYCWEDEVADLQLASWPGWIDQLVSDLVLLRPLDPVTALRGLNQLNDRVGNLNGNIENIDDILDRRLAYLRLYPAFEAEFANGDPLGLAERVVTLVTGDDLLDEGSDVPPLLLNALGRDGRVTVALRLADLRRAGSCPTVDLAWRMTDILLAEPRLADALALIAELGLEEQVAAWLVVDRLMEKGVVGPEFLAWVRRLLREPVGEMEDTLSIIMRSIQLCDEVGQPEMAQTIRREAVPVVLEMDMLREWLDRLPGPRREFEAARAMREVAGLEDKAGALLFLLRWPDLETAAQLVMEHHEAMAGQSCGTFNDAAACLEATAPRAAMLLYRRGAFCVFSTGVGLLDRKPRIDKCAALWARYPDGAYDSHAEFLDRLEQERRAGW